MLRCLKITKKTANNFLRRIYKRLDGGDVSIIFTKKIHPLYGCYVYKDGICFLCLNPRKDVIITFVHEILHAFYCDATEGEVLAMELQLMLIWSSRQLENLMKKISENVRRIKARKFNVLEELGDMTNVDIRRLKKEELKRKMLMKKYLPDGFGDLNAHIKYKRKSA